MIKEAARATNKVVETIGILPEIKSIFSEEGELPNFYIGKTYLHYLRLIRDLAQLSPGDKDLVAEANALSKTRGLSSNSVAKGGAANFIDIIGKENQEELLNFVSFAARPDSPVFQAALNDLNDRMTKAQGIPIEELSDGKSELTDYVIWGYRKGLKPKAMIHFTMCHFLERIVTQTLLKSNNPKIWELASHKDFFLNALGDIIRLKAAKNEVDPEIYNMWRLPRSEGGLQWNREEKQQVFNEVAGKLS